MNSLLLNPQSGRCRRQKKGSILLKNFLHASMVFGPYYLRDRSKAAGISAEMNKSMNSIRVHFSDPLCPVREWWKNWWKTYGVQNGDMEDSTIYLRHHVLVPWWLWYCRSALRLPSKYYWCILYDAENVTTLRL